MAQKISTSMNIENCPTDKKGIAKHSHMFIPEFTTSTRIGICCQTGGIISPGEIILVTRGIGGTRWYCVDSPLYKIVFSQRLNPIVQ